MLRHRREELPAGQLERNSDVLIGVHHDHIKLFLRRGQVGPAIGHGHLHLLRQAKIGAGDIGDLAVDLRALHGHARKIADAVSGVGAGPHAQDHGAAACVIGTVHTRHTGGCQRVVVVHSGELTVLVLHRLYTEEHIGGERGGVVIILDLEVVVDGLVLQGQVALPECEAVGGQRKAQPRHQHHRNNTGDRLLPFKSEVDNADSGQHTRKNQERGRRTHRRDGQERGHKGADDAADGVQRIQLPHGPAGVIQIVHGELGQGRCYGAQQHTGEGEDHQAGCQRRPDQKVLRYERGQQEGYPGDHPSARKGYQRDPDRGDDDPAIESVRRLALVSHPSAPDVAHSHSDHYNADNDRPNDLR